MIHLFQSFFLHAILILTFYGLRILVFEKNNLKKLENVKLLSSAVRVDVVELPKYTLQEMKQFKEVKKQEEKVEEKRESSNPSLEKMLQELSKKDIEKNQDKKSERIKEQLQKLIVAGNKLNQGESLDNNQLQDTREQEKVLAGYGEHIKRLVNQNWKLPRYLLDQGLVTKVLIRISKEGDIIDMRIVQKSGIDEHDEKALSAIRESKISPPPPILLERVRNQGMILIFPE